MGVGGSKLYLEAGAAVWLTRDFDRAAMFFNSATANGQSEACAFAFGFGGEEWFPNSLEVVRSASVRFVKTSSMS
ncbi:MAG TPA: hypothetical protein VGQ41_05305 [Pyrinomonadaceae bacterium]|jgi:hypothetical protein|nr:hypothetical protein [Pyrinomonadaceae bacterium]